MEEKVDIEVENSLYKRAVGYTVKIKKTIKCREVKFDKNSGKKISETEVLKEGEDEVHIPADVAAIIFWLKNRKPEVWKDKRVDDNGDTEETGVMILGEEEMDEIRNKANEE